MVCAPALVERSNLHSRWIVPICGSAANLEEGMMRVIEIDGKLDDDVEELLLVSGKLRTGEQGVRKVILEAIDPMIATGPEFEFEDRPGDDMWISLEVPDSGSVVDLAVAWRVAQLDARACALVLERDHSLAGS